MEKFCILTGWEPFGSQLKTKIIINTEVAIGIQELQEPYLTKNLSSKKFSGQTLSKIS